MKKNIYPIIGVMVLVSLWWFITATKLVNPLFLSSPLETVKSLFSFLFNQNGFAHLWSTFYRTLIGFIFAILLAVPIGIVVGTNKKIYSFLEVIIDFFRSLPATALFPLFILFLGIGDAVKIAVATFIAFWVIFINTVYGVWNQSKIRVQVAKVFRASRFQTFKEVTLPDILPQIFVGLRLAISYSLVVVVVAEMFIGAKYGLGQKIIDSYLAYRTSYLYAIILIVGLLGYLFSKLFIVLERRIVHWVGK